MINAYSTCLNLQNFCIMRTQRVYLFRMILTKISNFFAEDYYAVFMETQCIFCEVGLYILFFNMVDISLPEIGLHSHFVCMIIVPSSDIMV
jgi:hypothetical protein